MGTELAEPLEYQDYEVTFRVKIIGDTKRTLGHLKTFFGWIPMRSFVDGSRIIKVTTHIARVEPIIDVTETPLLPEGKES